MSLENGRMDFCDERRRLGLRSYSYCNTENNNFVNFESFKCDLSVAQFWEEPQFLPFPCL